MILHRFIADNPNVVLISFTFLLSYVFYLNFKSSDILFTFNPTFIESHNTPVVRNCQSTNGEHETATTLQKLSSEYTTVTDKPTTTAFITTAETTSSVLRTTTTEPKIRACLVPKLTLDDPEINDLMKHYKALECSSHKNWVYTFDGKFYIDSEVVKYYSNVTCDYYDIQRVSDMRQNQQLHKDMANGSALLGDGFRVVCRALDIRNVEVNYTNVHFGVPKVQKLHDSLPPERSRLINSHVFMYVIDSMSRMMFMRKLPKFYDVLTRKMDALIMEGYNIIGDGTARNVIPLTTGFFQMELPESRKRFWNASYLDDWPFIFKDFQNAGFATAYAEEQPQWSVFTYKIKGFDKPPVTHYLKPGLMLANDEAHNHVDYCLGDTPKSIVWLKYWKELRHMYETINRRTFAFMFSAEFTHESDNWVQALDDHLVEQFREIMKHELLNNTFLIIMGDHGRRFGWVRATQQGKMEEKLPFLAVIPPPWFKQKYPKSYANLMQNREALMTPFDIHETLKHLLDFKEDGEEGDLRDRGISIFKKIPETRTCTQAAIKPHFCSCLDWFDVKDLNDSSILNATYFVIGKFNSMLKDAKDLCAPLSLKRLVSAKMMKPKDEVLGFKESVDSDNLAFDLSDDRNLTSITYELRFITSPNNGEFDVTVTHFINLSSFTFSADDVSRLDEYGNQAKCIFQTQHHLRQYCYCNSKEP